MQPDAMPDEQKVIDLKTRRKICCLIDENKSLLGIDVSKRGGMIDIDGMDRLAAQLKQSLIVGMTTEEYKAKSDLLIQQAADRSKAKFQLRLV